MPATHRNRLVTAISNTPGGAGALTIAAASSGYRTFAAADDGLSFDVSIVDGTAWEIRTGCVYTHAGTSLARGTLEDSSTGSAITLTSAAVVTVTATAGRANAGQTVLTHADRSANYGAFTRNNGTNTQTITDAVWTSLVGEASGCLRTEEWNVGPIWSADSAGRMTLPEGRWMLGGSAGVDALTTVQRLLVGLAKNGEVTPSRLLARCGAPAQSATVCLSGSTIVESNGTDYFQIKVFVDGSGTHVTALSAGFIYFWAQYLGPVL